jgi:hypothetical protein
MSCITLDSVLTVEDLVENQNYNVLVASGPITITFSCATAINSITVDPPDIRPSGNSLTFDGTYVNTVFTVNIDYAAPSLRDAGYDSGNPVHPLQTPTKLPKFKPVNSCP